MKKPLNLFNLVGILVYTIASLSLLGISLAMLAYALWEVYTAVHAGERIIDNMLNAIGLIVIAVAGFDVSKYLMEEEVLRDRELRSAREARQTLTKFLVIIIIAVSLEALVFVFRAGSKNFADLLYPTLLIGAAAFLVITLGLYQRLSTDAERSSNAR
jgi:formate hydrogenlyase subunit 3/multisubunit Na+/H+ antiporter MnhD subunit